jgi:hypothetical protein
MIWVILIAAGAVILWRTGKWPFDRSYTIGGIKIPKYGDPS